jgi:hypothetical protein
LKSTTNTPIRTILPFIRSLPSFKWPFQIKHPPFYATGLAARKNPDR